MVAVRGSGGGVRQRVCVCVRILEDGVQKIEVRGGPSKIECFTICSVAVLIIARLRNRKKLEKQEDLIKKLAYINARMFR